MSYWYDSINEIRATNRLNGYHFFSEGALEFFKSIVHSEVYEGRYFITSEEGPVDGRRYSVRQANEDGTISTKGQFNSHLTELEAIDAIFTKSWRDA